MDCLFCLKTSLNYYTVRLTISKFKIICINPSSSILEQGSYAVWKSMEIDFSNLQIWINLEKSEFLNINVSYKQSVKVLKFSDHFNTT